MKLHRVLLGILIAAILIVVLAGTAHASTSHVLKVNGVEYTDTKVSGTAWHFETPAGVVPVLASVAERSQTWTGNGSDNLPCPYGIHWISNENMLTISHCLDASTTTTTAGSTTTTTPRSSSTTTTIHDDESTTTSIDESTTTSSTTSTIIDTTTSTIVDDSTTTTVVEVGGPTTTTIVESGGPTTTAPIGLPRTGGSPSPILMLGATLLILGLLATLIRRPAL